MVFGELWAASTVVSHDLSTRDRYLFFLVSQSHPTARVNMLALAFLAYKVITMRTMSFLALACLALISTLGCGPHEVSHNPGIDVYPATAKVTQDGQPIEGARVSYSSADQQRSASGTTNAEGIALLTTFDHGDGAVPGEHRVKITKDEIEVIKEADLDDPMSQAQIKTIHHLPQKYGNYRSSGLSATVSTDAEANTFEFELE